MVKSTAIIFILTFSILMKLEKCRFSLVFVVLFISVGLVLFTFHSTQFNWTGFLLVLTAAFTSGFRWTLSQVVTQKSEIGLSNPLDMMYHIQPWMIIGLLPLSSYVEGVPLASSHHLFRFHEISEIFTSAGIVIGGAFLAFMLEFSEFLLLSRTSGLTLSISGIFKEICTIVLAHITFGDKMNPINFLGLVICLFGIALHVILKAVHRKEDEKELHNNSESMEMLLVNGEANSTDEEEAELFDRNAVRPPRVHKHSE
ncbi:solute carrier family 35 member C2-like [Lingula anatina]|uniref:Solute carrier family 35 member C2-like n=1 Tax=Lingula anatina TaxID=7574 RepID=A0A1S3J8I0_LINAN|nr:solute carrier family 35 member C2-like [Lingula anatina]|eukprot:XP_013406174.1 solute carrier family 35 member C2-like [Lingula anatina]